MVNLIFNNRFEPRNSFTLTFQKLLGGIDSCRNHYPHVCNFLLSLKNLSICNSNREVTHHCIAVIDCTDNSSILPITTTNCFKSQLCLKFSL